jgi:hypothetical protein
MGIRSKWFWGKEDLRKTMHVSYCINNFHAELAKNPIAEPKLK